MHEIIFGRGFVLGSLLMTILLMPVVQASYADNSTIVINASGENKDLSFSITTSDSSPSIYGFVVTSVSHGHYSEIIKSPEGWSPGVIRNLSAMWTTKDHPIEPGSTEDDFVVEVTRKGTYEIRWSALDNSWQPVAWGTITITVN
ncbi:MAG: hypothetical protein ACE5JV_01095 [Nitrososphaerales archaeon]